MGQLKMKLSGLCERAARRRGQTRKGPRQRGLTPVPGPPDGSETTTTEQ